MRELAFRKMNGLGNSFVVMNDLDGQVSAQTDLPALARRICDVHFGIGADGLVLVKASANRDFRMVIYNADGSEAEMCGNGIRCFARYLREEGMTANTELHIETLAGTIVTTLCDDGQVTVDMGAPVFRNADVVAPEGNGPARVTAQGREFLYVSMGNPHAVAFVDNLDFNWREEGAAVERSTQVFPRHTNVEYVRVDGAAEVTMKVWERGCGETMACGTGACALVVAGVEDRRLSPGDVRVHLPGGDLMIRYESGTHVWMTGPAVTVCRGTFLLDS